MEHSSIMSDEELLDAVSSVSTNNLLNVVTSTLSQNEEFDTNNNIKKCNADKVDSTTDDVSCYDNIDLINLFIKKYNQKRGTNESMFSGLNEKDPTTTTEQMELFYGYMEEFNKLIMIDDMFVDIYDEKNFVQNIDHSIYAIINNKTMGTLCISMSFLSLLKYGNDFLSDSDLWNIIKIK